LSEKEQGIQLLNQRNSMNGDSHFIGSISKSNAGNRNDEKA